MSHLLHEIQMKAVGCVMHLRENKSQMLFSQAFTSIATQLDLDDVGYFYNPNNSDLLLTTPGQMVGIMNNNRLPTYQFGVAVSKAVFVIKTIDEDYDKLLVIATDYAKETDMYYFKKAIE